MTFGLIGYPLSHSFSKGYFTRKFSDLGLAGSHQYLNFPMEDIKGFCDLRELYPDLRGVNVTLPHKKAVMPLLDTIDPAAARIGAVNCIRFDDAGNTTGFNTDYLGFRDDFLSHLRRKDWTAQAFGLPTNDDLLETFLETSNALILGTGGASLAVREALRNLGIEATFVSRTPAEGQYAYTDLSREVIADNLFIINTTPLGMSPNIDTAPSIPYELLSKAHFCYDLVYNPAETAFLKKAKNNGAVTGNGLGMLERQAEAGWAIWQQDYNLS